MTDCSRIHRAHGRTLPPEPTEALPGTPEKVRVLRERYWLRQVLWHPQDARLKDAGQRAIVPAADHGNGMASRAACTNRDRANATEGRREITEAEWRALEEAEAKRLELAAAAEAALRLYHPE